MDAEFHRVVSIHNVALWPELESGLDELRRVLRADGMLLLAWHGGHRPPWTTKNLRLEEAKLARIERALGERFARVERAATRADDVFRAWQPR